MSEEIGQPREAAAERGRTIWAGLRSASCC